MTVALTSPGAGTPVKGDTQVAAQVTFVELYPDSGFKPPGKLVLEDDTGNRWDLAAQPPPGGTTQPYAGTYSPGTGVERLVPITAVATTDDSATEIASAPVLLDVDTQAPIFQTASAMCGSPNPCLRDAQVQLLVNVTDAHLKTVVATLDLDVPTHSQSLAAVSGVDTSGSLNLREWPFGFFSQLVHVTFTATDENGNTGSSPTIPLSVTRARDPFLAGGTPVTSPAVEKSPSDTIVFGVAGTTNQLRGIDSSNTLVFQTTLEIATSQGKDLRAAPSVGEANIFAGSEDGRVHRVGLDGGMPSGVSRWPATTDTTAVPFNSLYTPITNTVLGVDHTYSAGGAAALYQFYSNQSTATLGLANPVQAAGVFVSLNLFYATSDGTAATLRRFTDAVLDPQESASVALTDPGPPVVVPCDKVQVPLAVDGSGRVIAACDNGQVHRVANMSPLVDELLYKLPAGVSPTGSPVVLADGGILIPASDGNLWKLVPSGSTATPWTDPALVADSAGEFVVGVAAAGDTGDVPAGSAPAIYATTSAGRLVALDALGGVKWSGTLDAAAGALGFPTIAPAPGTASSSALPTLYAGSSSGKLYRIVVDTDLDRNAPWPKAHHDIRNTGSNGSVLP